MKTSTIGILVVGLVALWVATVGYRHQVNNREEQQRAAELRMEAAKEQRLKELVVKKYSEGVTLSPFESEELRQLTEWKAKRDIDQRGK